MAHTVKQTHPIRGALWGLMLGVGLSLVLVVTTVIYLELVPIIMVIAAAIVVGILWGLFAPAKPPKDPEPVRVEQTHAPESTRFDDFDAPTSQQSPAAPAPAAREESAAADETATAGVNAEHDPDAVTDQPTNRSDPPPAP